MSSVDCPGLNVPDFSIPMVRCGYPPATHLAWWRTPEFGVCSGPELRGAATLFCERNPAYTTPSCYDYKLHINLVVSGCISVPSDPLWPDSCQCGDYSTSTEAVWEWIDKFEVTNQAGFPGCPLSCGCDGHALPLPFDVRIHGMPPDPATLPLGFTPLKVQPRMPVDNVDDKLPEDVSNWLND
jgi:hypothetical protein